MQAHKKPSGRPELLGSSEAAIEILWDKPQSDSFGPLVVQPVDVQVELGSEAIKYFFWGRHLFCAAAIELRGVLPPPPSDQWTGLSRSVKRSGQPQLPPLNMPSPKSIQGPVDKDSPRI
ncbi:hypothetical protein RRG08_055985 [Elysia crispata]|uniref:Uncharacterized protein n=1 Tax=Elysia crispata TaxID=231223 RepID=A0AAE1AGR0_9GAST|nr:hypothetical protein RRG08_055985 [Elysia crispata]